MKKFEMNAKYNEVKVVAQELGIKFVGIKTADLIEMVNAKIEELTPKVETKKAKWFEVEGFSYNEGDVVNVIGGALNGRQAIISKPSAKKNATKAFLINPYTGQLQKTHITLDLVNIELVPTTQLPMVV